MRVHIKNRFFFFFNLSHRRQVYLVVLKQEEQAHSSFSAILFTMKSFAHAKSMERADPWDRYNLYNLYVTYAFGSAHVKVRRLNRSRTFAVLFDWRSRTERRVDSNTNLSILTDSYVDVYMRRTKRLGSAHVKFDVWTGPNIIRFLVKPKNYDWFFSGNELFS